MSDTYYLCNKQTKSIISIGPIPEVWGDITGLSGASYEDVSNLSWAGFPNLGFLTEADALSLGVDPSVVNAQKLKSADSMWAQIRDDRDDRIRSVRWRLERHQDEVQAGVTPTENVMPLLKYVQELRDITSQPDPFNIKWPPMPV